MQEEWYRSYLLKRRESLDSDRMRRSTAFDCSMLLAAVFLSLAGGDTTLGFATIALIVANHRATADSYTAQVCDTDFNLCEHFDYGDAEYKKKMQKGKENIAFLGRFVVVTDYCLTAMFFCLLVSALW